MPKFLIEYEIEAADLNQATQVSLEILWLAETNVDSVRVSPLGVESGRTFSEQSPPR